MRYASGMKTAAVSSRRALLLPCGSHRVLLTETRRTRQQHPHSHSLDRRPPVCEKTGVARQAELVKLVAGYAMPLLG
jgi:Flp pilus assembly CpaF family ATPase